MSTSSVGYFCTFYNNVNGHQVTMNSVTISGTFYTQSNYCSVLFYALGNSSQVGIGGLSITVTLSLQSVSSVIVNQGGSSNIVMNNTLLTVNSGSNVYNSGTFASICMSCSGFYMTLNIFTFSAQMVFNGNA